MVNLLIIFFSLLVSIGLSMAFWIFVMTRKILAYETRQEQYTHLLDQNTQLEKDLKQKTSEINNANAELYKTNIQLHQEKDKAGAIIKYMADGILVIDNEGIILESNELVLDLFEIPHQSIIGQPVKDIIIYPQYISALDRIQNDVQTKTELDVSIIREDKTWKTLNLKITKAIDKKGNPLGLISLIRDISKQKELDTLKNNFIRTISHELRTPLTSIIGFIDILKTEKRGPLTDDQKEYLDVILKGSLHLRQLINDLLDISLMESKKLKIKFEYFDICAICRDIAMSCQPQTKLKGIELVFKENPSLPPVYSDEDKARRIFINILNNAIKFTSKGYVKIFFSTNGPFVNIHIEDSGIGINPQAKELIFERFRQIDSSSTRKYEGLGIGLTIVKDLLNILGGTIQVQSEENKGSTFIFSLPTRYNQERGGEYDE